MRKVCCFHLPTGTHSDLIEEQVATAIFAAECVFGKPRVRLCAAYWVDGEGRRCLVDIGDAIGEHIAQILIGCFTREFGESGFSVERRAATEALSRPIGTTKAKNARGSSASLTCGTHKG